MNHEEYFWGDESQGKYVHVSELDKYEDAKGFLIDVLDSLYGNKSLDDMERALEEACAHMEIPFPKGNLKVNKNNPYFQLGAAMSRTQARVLSRKKMEYNQ